MSDKRKQSGGKEIRRIRMTDDQYREARSVISARENAAILIGQAMAEALSKLSEQDVALWDQLRAVAGIDCESDKILSVEWITRDLVVRQREDCDDDQ